MSKEEIPDLMIMCSELYTAALEGRTEEVTELLAGSSHATTAARNGRPSPAARANAVHPGHRCTTREVAAERSTLLHVAAGQGHCALITELCLRDSALLSSVNSSLDTPLHCAARHGHTDAVEAIVWLTRSSVEEDRLRELLGGRNGAGDTALHVAARHGRGETVEVLMKLAPEMAAEVNGSGVSPLYLAVMSRSMRAVEAIVGYQDASAAGPMSQNALHAAVLQSSGIRDNHGRSFLHAAALRGHSSIVSQVIKNRMLENLLNQQDREGSTALHLAVESGEYGTVSKLLSSGKVQVHIMNNAGHTPADLIEKSTGFYSMVRLAVKLYVYGAQFRPQRQDLVKKWSGQDLVKWRVATSKNLAIVSTLVATVAFSAAFNVPGSYGSDGKANLNENRMYTAFLVLDTIAVTTAVMATILLVYGRASQSNRSWLGFIISMHFLWLSLLCMMLGFFTAIAATSDRKSTSNALYRVIYFGLYVLIMLLTSLAMPGSLRGVLRLLLGREGHLKRRIKRQYPFVVVYTFNMLLFIVVNNIALASVETTGNLR
ncbi:hypothetical protein C2845_PM18G07750 [Panicum miliaceum]|uniref:PGG domain-containing protein n=1 Tax=Panicum miliaceum TaxID=4540 RepID=A0A3L6PK19_PANMI|nr:hypothetical protein C2845_PM18G07750 [Panicum miliaceum]